MRPAVTVRLQHLECDESSNRKRQLTSQYEYYIPFRRHRDLRSAVNASATTKPLAEMSRNMA